MLQSKWSRWHGVIRLTESNFGSTVKPISDLAKKSIQFMNSKTGVRLDEMRSVTVTCLPSITLFTAKKATQCAKWIWNWFNCESKSGFDNQISPWPCSKMDASDQVWQRSNTRVDQSKPRGGPKITWTLADDLRNLHLKITKDKVVRIRLRGIFNLGIRIRSLNGDVPIM